MALQYPVWHAVYLSACMEDGNLFACVIWGYPMPHLPEKVAIIIGIPARFVQFGCIMHRIRVVGLPFFLADRDYRIFHCPVLVSVSQPDGYGNGREMSGKNR